MAIRFTSILRDIILENTRNTILFDKYVKPGKDRKSIMTIQTLFDIIAADPTSRVPEGMDSDNLKPEDIEKVKIGKYTQWMLKNFVTPTGLDVNSPNYKSAYQQSQLLFMENLYKITGDLMKYEKFKGRLPQEYRDINKLTPETLYDYVKDFSLEKVKATAEEKKVASKTYEHPGAEITYRGSDWTVAKISDQGPLGKEAACFYGGNHLDPAKGETRWCTSSPGLTWFENYIKKGPLYVVIPNSPKKYTGSMDVGEKSGLPAYRYQFHFPDKQFMDPADRQIDLVKFLQENEPGLKEYFKFEMIKDLAQENGEKVSIQYPDSAGSKFIALYGFDDLFKVLPKTLKNLEIINNGGDGSFSFDVPETIGEFTNLTRLHFINCVTRIPDSVCNLKKLSFLSLPENKKLEKLPACLADLPNLAMINLRGGTLRPGVLPESIKQKVLNNDEFFIFPEDVDYGAY